MAGATSANPRGSRAEQAKIRGQLGTGHAARHFRSKGRHRRRNAAMKDSAEFDDDRDRARSGGSLRSFDRPSGSTRESRTTHESRSHHRHSHRESSMHSRRRSRERSRDRHGRSPSESSRKRAEPVDDLIPRYRASKEHERDSVDAEKRSLKTSGRDRGDSVPSSASKRLRRRSRSPSHERSHRKKSRRERSPYRRGDADEDHDSRKRRRHSPHESRKSSPRSHGRRSRSYERDDSSHSRRRSRSRHSVKDTAGSADMTRDSRHQKSSRPRHRSRTRSPANGLRNRSPVGHRSGSRDRHGTSSSKPPRVRSREPIPDENRPTPIPSSPRRDRYHNDLDEHYSRRRANPNDDMPRSGYRGDYPPSFPHKPYHEDGYRRSPQPPAPFHDPPSEPAHTSGRGWPSHRYSPQSHYSAQYSTNDRDYGHHATSQTHYPPDSRQPPSGPQHPGGGYRGGGRGNGFRGSFSGRGGGSDSTNGVPRTGANAVGMQDRSDEDWNGARPPEDPPTDKEQSMKGNRPMAPPNRPPPTGPAAHNNPSSKFSFAFKASSKPAATAPKPEISQKFNAISKGAQQSDAQDREPPKSAPTEPASARAWNEGRIPDGPRMAPRMRKVKKMMKRPKIRPTLSPDLAASESVFYRKPGNESVVGSGTYGKVFKGLNVYTKGLVALKRIRMEGERDGFPVTAVREIKLLQSLRHLNIVMLQEVMVEKNDCFMVFEYMSHDLTGLLNHPTFKLEPAQKKHLAKQMFDGLDYLHTRGVLHRDIKAANILVSSDGVLKIADFGLARFYAKHHRLDYTNRVITIWYRSPELLLGETQYTAAVDVWSAACVMVEIFTRGAIFPGDGTELNQLEKIYNVLGTPNRRDWPGLVDMAWFELLRPGVKRKSVFADKYADKVTPAAFDLLEAMFLYDPAKRPTAAQVLQHAYFTVEEPLPRQAVELASIEGEWHEFESKALRKENERKAREARRAEAAGASTSKDRDRKRAHETRDDSSHREHKRTHLDGQGSIPEAGDPAAAEHRTTGATAA